MIVKVRSSKNVAWANMRTAGWSCVSWLHDEQPVTVAHSALIFYQAEPTKRLGNNQHALKED
jgi:hypothetical protein